MGKRGRKREPRRSNHSRPLPSNGRSFELKLARAQHHLQDIQEQLQGWIDSCLHSLREEPDPKEPGYYCAWIDAPEVDLGLLSLRVGDCLQCSRSALDHPAFELATTFTSPLPDEFEKRSEFPIFGDQDGKGSGRFDERRSKGAQAGNPTPTSGLAKVAGMDPAAQAVIEGLQPYHRGNTFEDDPLWRLHELNRIDKHRLLHVATRVMGGATMPMAGPAIPKAQWPRNVAAIKRADGQPFQLEIKGDIAAEGRTLVARWPMLPIDPGKKMHMGLRPVLNIVFDTATPLVANLPVSDPLADVDNHIVNAVLPPLVGFLK